jgi:oligopeptidase B
MRDEATPGTAAGHPDRQPPVAPRRAYRRDLHGETVADDYAWMRRVDDPALLGYLAAENEWARQRTAPLADLESELFDELCGLLPEDDASAPEHRGSWSYVSRRRPGQQYRVHCRRPGGSATSSAGEEQVLLDENELARGHDYLDLGVLEVSPDQRLLAYSLDTDGSEVYTLRVRDLATGQDRPDLLTGTYYTLAWTANSAGFLYTTLDAAYRPDRVWHHLVGTGQQQDRLVLAEPDRRFELTTWASRSGRLLLVAAHSRDTAEVLTLPADRPEAAPRPVLPRRPGVDYEVEDSGAGLVAVVVDDAGPDGRLVALGPDGVPVELLGHAPGVRLAGVDAFGDHLVVTERHLGRLRLRVLDRDGRLVRLLEPDTPGESVRLGPSHEFAPDRVRVVREGWLRPRASYDVDLRTGDERLVHEQALAAARPDRHRCEVRTATAEDGTEVPVTVLVPPGAGDRPGPCLLYGYGAYEASLDPEFWPELLPLLDRGVTVAIAHVRGGGELGRTWWLQGRLLTKRNTFTDFVACARMLVRTGWTTPGQLVARGMSAGGLLVGAAVHLAPEAFAGVVAEVPFVDVVGTMLDDTLPLTVGEWEEWGDPREAEQYHYLRGYAPYDNLPGPDRPALLVTASRHDPRVSVHEPAKWVARMRADDAEAPDGRRPAELLLRTAMGGGAHTGPAGRYDAWRHEASLLAFVLGVSTRTGGASAPGH